MDDKARKWVLQYGQFLCVSVKSISALDKRASFALQSHTYRLTVKRISTDWKHPRERAWHCGCVGRGAGDVAERSLCGRFGTCLGVLCEVVNMSVGFNVNRRHARAEQRKHNVCRR